MKVLHITPWYEPAWATGGTAVAASNMCREIARQGVDTTVFTTNDLGNLQTVPDNESRRVLGGVKVHYFRCPKRIMQSRRSALSAELCYAILCQAKPFDLLHIHSTRHVYATCAALAARRSGRPYIVTPHASLLPWWIEGIGRPWLKKLYINAIDRHALSGAAALHYLSDFEREQSRMWAFNDSHFTIPNGIADAPERVEIPKRAKGLRLMHVGRIHPQKNTFELIKAIGSLSKNTVSLDIIGPTDDANFHRKCLDYIQAERLGNVRFLGSLPHPSVLDAYQNYDLFCMPSIAEGVSMALIEAASRGLPALVSSQVGNHREIIEDNAGLLCDLNAESIASVIRDIADDPAAVNALKENALASVQKRYRIDRVATQLISHYRHAIQKKGVAKTPNVTTCPHRIHEV